MDSTLDEAASDEAPSTSVLDVLTWLGNRKGFIAKVTVLATVLGVAAAFLLPPTYTARATLLPPGSQQQGNAAALAALSSLGGMGGLGGLGSKTSDELYVALLKSDSMTAMLDQQFKLRERYEVKSVFHLKTAIRKYVRVTSDKKTGVITVEVDDSDPAFSAALVNAHAPALTQLLGRLAVGEAKQRRMFFEAQLKETKERLVQAEQDFRKMQESTGFIVLDKQAEALIGSAAGLSAQIAAREVQMKVLRTSATDQNPDVQRLGSELRALRAELARLESNAGATVNPGGGGGKGTGGNSNSSVSDMQVGRIPGATIDYVRARREVKLQEVLLEGMVRQYEMAKLDEAKEGPMLQQIDVAETPDAKSKPSRALILLGALLGGLSLSSLWVVVSGMIARQQAHGQEGRQAWQSLRAAWRWKAG